MKCVRESDNNNNNIIIIVIMGFQWNPRGGSSLHCFQVELEFGNVGFCGRRKTRGVEGARKGKGEWKSGGCHAG